MRTYPAVATAALLLAACDTFPVTVEPQLQVSPYLAVYRLRGDTAMQSEPGPNDNAAQNLYQFGLGSHKEDVGVRVDLGDGFAGLRADYYRLDQDTSKSGVLDDDWGALLLGDQVQMSATMDEIRVGWLQEVLSHRAQVRGGELQLRAGLGVTYAHRGMTLRGRTVDLMRAQNLSISGDLLYGAARVQAAWESVALDLDYAISPELVLGGDWGGIQHDFEARLSYRVPYQDVTFFGGWRYSVLEADGTQGSFGYDADLRIDGFQFGVQVGF